MSDTDDSKHKDENENHVPEPEHKNELAPEDKPADLPKEEPKLQELKPVTADKEFSWAHAFAIVGVLALMVIAFLAYVVVNKQKDSFLPGMAIDEINRKAHEYLALQGEAGSLVLASSEHLETFVKIPKSAIISGWMSPNSASEKFELPVVYEFGVSTEAEWKLQLEGNVCLVSGPELTVLRVLSGDVAKEYNQKTATGTKPEAKEDPIIVSLQAQLNARAHMLLEGKEGHNIRTSAKEKLESILKEWLLDIGAFRNPEFATVKLLINEPALPQLIEEIAEQGRVAEKAPEKITEAATTKEKTEATDSNTE